jgi:hypothetical protein
MLVTALCATALVALPAAPAGAKVAPLPSQWQKGVNVTAYWWTDLSGHRFATWLKRARTQVHADRVTFVVTWYQRFSAKSQRVDHLNATTIAPSYGSRRTCKAIGDSWRACKTPSMAALRNAVRLARKDGFKVGIRPQVDVGRDALTAAPRDRIDVRGAGRQAWFKSYSNLLSQYARLARDTKADTLVIGSDLTGMTNEPEDLSYWHHLIADVRSGALMGDGKGYKGQLTYAETWKQADAEAADPKVHRFPWNELDAIGVDAYFPLVSASKPHDNPSVGTLRAGWATHVPTIRALHAEFDKPVVFTGLGYLSRKGTSVAPDNPESVQAANGGTRLLQAQERPVAATFDVWSAVAKTAPWFQGIWWSEWPASGRGGHQDGSFSLQGKPAERVLCRWYLGNPSAKCPVPSRVG